MERNPRNSFQDLRQRHLYVSRVLCTSKPVLVLKVHMLSAITSTPTASQEIESMEGFGLVITIQFAPADNGPMDLPRLWSLKAKIISAQKAWISMFPLFLRSMYLSYFFKGLLRQIIMQHLSGIKVKFRFAQKCSPRGACLWSIQLFKAIDGTYCPASSIQKLPTIKWELRHFGPAEIGHNQAYQGNPLKLMRCPQIHVSLQQQQQRRHHHQQQHHHQHQYQLCFLLLLLLLLLYFFLLFFLFVMITIIVPKLCRLSCVTRHET